MPHSCHPLRIDQVLNRRIDGGTRFHAPVPETKHPPAAHLASRKNRHGQSQQKQAKDHPHLLHPDRLFSFSNRYLLPCFSYLLFQNVCLFRTGSGNPAPELLCCLSDPASSYRHLFIGRCCTAARLFESQTNGHLHSEPGHVVDPLGVALFSPAYTAAH